MKIVRGVQDSWDSNIATTLFPFDIGAATWSPCNRFIAISPRDTIRVDILDSTTLQRLQSLGSGGLGSSPLLIFSPDSRRLTYCGCSAHRDNPYAPYLVADEEVVVVTWDLQTGGIVSVIEWDKFEGRDRGSDESGDDEMGGITYSANGKMVAILSPLAFSKVVISIFDVVSGVYMHSIDCPKLEGPHLYYIWSYGESIKFATAESTGITIWEVSFALGATPMEVKTLPGLKSVEEVVHFEFHPASHRAVFVYSNQILVWDAEKSISLLHQADINPCTPMSFSSDGSFFAYTTSESGAYLWKVSPTGYLIHGKILPSCQDPRPLFSPNGQSIIIFGNHMVQLWQTSSFTAPPFNTSAQLPQKTEKFVLDFFQDRLLAVVARQRDNVVAVLDLKSGVPQLTIDTSIEIYGLGAIKNTIVALGCREAITWNLPKGNLHPGINLSVEDSNQTMSFDVYPMGFQGVTAASMSPNFQYIALIIGDQRLNPGVGHLWVYNTFTEQHFASAETTLEGVPWFSPENNNIWCAIGGNRAEVWEIVGNHLEHATVLDDIEEESWEGPWRSSDGYHVLDDGWILGLDEKRLFMLPPLWQSDAAQRMWSGQFLAFLHATLPEPVIIELEM